ncbi:hypothetical protein [Paraflavitalea pollutisoli]|uniref:hypothetical protein n=1 Tax=Paraflavitalea pollutisoli TaxID=3034143 RepID=UPI0023EE0D82|nr:hypothetical protein [Paraflavitalea sp. H1-2-19X]
MKSIPFLIGFVLIVPSVDVFSAGTKRSVQQVSRHGVGALLYAEQAILHDSIKEDICHEASVIWVGGPAGSDPISRLAVEMIMCNTRFISVANAWYRVSSPGLRHAGAVGQAAGGLGGGLRGRLSVGDGRGLSLAPLSSGGILVTLFGEEAGILAESGEDGSPEMAIVVERYADVQVPKSQWQRSQLRVVAG